MRELQEIIESAYALFAPYTVGATLDVCPCCVSDAEQQELLATPLRQVPRRLLQNAYYESARNYSDQERWEMKHFLPRVLELVSQFEFPCHSDEITFRRLDLNLPLYWPPAERELLAKFALVYVGQCLQHYPLPGTHFTDLLVMFGIAHFELAPLLSFWAATDTLAGLVYFVDLLVDDTRVLSNGIIKFTNPFSEPPANQQLTVWLTDPAVQARWQHRLEQAIMHEQLPGSYNERASWAYDLLRHNLPRSASQA